MEIALIMDTPFVEALLVRTKFPSVSQPLSGLDSAFDTMAPDPRNFRGRLCSVPVIGKRHRNTFHHCLHVLGSVFGRTDFSRIFIFEPPDFFADFFTDFFLIVMQQNHLKSILQKSPTTFW